MDIALLFPLKNRGEKMKSGLTKLLIFLAVATALASIALTFAKPYQVVTEETSAEYHEECEELMEQMHEEHTDMMNEMHHNNHNTYDAQMHNETAESQDRHGCH